MLSTHRAGKGPGGCRGWGSGSRNRRGPDVPPAPGLIGRGTPPGSPAAFLGLSGWGKHPCSFPAPLVLESHLSPASAVLSWPPSYVPRINPARRGPLRVQDPVRELGKLPRPIGQGKRWACSSLIRAPGGPFGHGNLSPPQPPLRGAGPVGSPLLQPPQSPTSYQFARGFFPSP